ncbi:hypothetical protein Lsan_1107 [Legionella santicrucis]|uniref:Uncharacterized protein n=1 Tax=Legionella santicrucis TaxID=45074 RepID=A0A0W0Z3G3_9GAMM|nr:hypothetical protein [Legionella santicrucis]KTD63674.1 hypothetical protein Lsan_1107 [Legionella santicrucis]
MESKYDLSALNKPFPLQKRVELFKSLMKEHPNLRPELIPSKSVRQMFDHDLAYAKHALIQWETYIERSQKAQKNINTFFDNLKLKETMSFAEHAYYCFCLSAFITGIEPEQLELEYKKQLKTMVYGVVHPLGDWSIKTELENQDYSKFISHVSMSGLVKIQDINQMTSFRLDEQSPFFGIRVLAIACGEHVSFDGVKTMNVDGATRETRSLEVLKHDLIHAGFLKRHYQKDVTDFWQRFTRVGLLFEQIYNDQKLQDNPLLKNKVEAVLFFFLHEHTTSIYVDGIPEKLPRKHLRIGNKYAMESQILLRAATKTHLIPTLFINEVEVELSILRSLKIINLSDEEINSLNEHELVVMMMDALQEGYQYLSQYADFYNNTNPKHWPLQFIQREVDNISHAITSVASRPHFWRSKPSQSQPTTNNPRENEQKQLTPLNHSMVKI